MQRQALALMGVNRIFLPTSKIYPTLVASDSADYISTVGIEVGPPEAFKRKFLEKVYAPHNFRKITKEEACRIQSFPDNFILPETRARWMKLLGNSVCPKVVQMIAQSVVDTGIFKKK
jgi:DNA (cytosine-5)-methyltransferase 1